ncbi:MAG: hypothetical protein IJL17_02890 [Kiritimatiellae bacterium]|nr:hypothetical protein [Kiritimatiellia bacterium]
MSLNTALSNTGPKRRGSPIPIILILLVLGAGGYFGWKAFSDYQADKRRKQEAIRAENERIRAKNEMIMKSGVKPKTNEVAQVEEDEPKFDLPPEPPKKTEAEILREEETLRTNVWAQIEAARKKGDATPLPAFAGIQFGKPLVPGATLDQVSSKIVKWGTALKEEAGDSVATRGVAFAVYGPKLAKPFMSLGTSPLVWVTPKERRPYRIEFSRPLAPKADKHDPETTNLVANLQAKFKVEPFAPRPSVPGRAGCEYVFPIGTSTVTVGEYDGVLRFSVEREDVRDEARAETEALRQEKSQVSADGALLDSKRYPNGGFDRAKYRGMQPFREGTPPAFCGVVFGSQPAETATVVVPQKGPKGFFLDYGMAKCPPFRGFAYGRADVDPVRGGVYAVHLTSEGGTEGQDDRDYYESVKASLSAHYKVKPIEKPGDGAFPNLIYQVGDVTILFGPDPRGGFRLFARNEVLTALAHTEPVAANTRKR